MAGTSGDIIRVSLEYSNAISTLRNIFFYRLDDPPTAGYLTGLLTEFQTAVLTPLAAWLTTGFTFVELVATNIFSGDEVVDVTPTPAAGTRTPSGDHNPAYVAVMLMLERQNSRVRNGRKFFPIPLEADNQNVSLVAGSITLLNAVASGMDNTLNPGGTDTFVPVIVGRIPYTTGTGRTAYRLPASQGEMGDAYSDVTSVRVINRPTTMNTRKFWRGE